MNCKECGKKVTKTNKFCPNCGFKIEIQEEVKEIVQEEIKEQPSQQQTIVTPKIEVKKPTGLFVGAIILAILSLLSLNFFALILAIIAIVYLCTYNEERSAEQQNRKINNGKVISIIAWVLYGIGMIIRIGIIILAIIFANNNLKNFDFDNIFDFIEKYSDSHIQINYEPELEEDEPEEYPETNQYLYLTEINYNELLELYNGTPKSIVVLVQTYCGYCNIYKPIINEIAKEQNITINYIDVTKLDSTSYNNLTSNIDFLREHAESWGTPTTLIVSSGQTLGYLEGSVSKESTINFYKQYSLIK